MAHSYHETRVGAHRIISVVLMPSPFSPQLDQITKMSEKVSSESLSIQHENLLGAEYMNGKHTEEREVVGASEKYAICPYHVHIFPRALMDGKHELSSFRLSSHQVSLLLSSIWFRQHLWMWPCKF